jgi:hypothetical protein
MYIFKELTCKNDDACNQLLRVSEKSPHKRKWVSLTSARHTEEPKADTLYFWSKENPNFFQELENNPPRVMT